MINAQFRKSIYQQLSAFIVFFNLIFSSPQIYADDAVKETLANDAWEKRQLIVFTPSETHPQFQLFNQSAAAQHSGVMDRRLQVWRVSPEVPVTLDNHVRSELNSQQFYEYFQINPKDFRVLLIGYDQGEKLRQEKVDLDTVFAEIDRMPMRIREMSE